LKGVTLNFSKVCAIPLKHTKTSCLKPMFIYSTLIHAVKNILIVPLSYLLERTRPSSMQYLHFILSSSFLPLGVYWNGNQVGRCSHVVGVLVGTFLRCW
jgi:hypothetical protein